MPEDRNFIKRTAAALDKVMAKPFVPTHGVPLEAPGRKRNDQLPMKVEKKRKRKQPAKADEL